VGCAIPRELPAARAAGAGGPGEACCASHTCEGRPYSNMKRPGGGTSSSVGPESQAEAGPTTLSQALWHLQGYFIFREEGKAYITNFCSGISSRTVAKYMRSSCLLASMRMYVAHADSPEEIFETWDGIFCRPNKLIDSIMEPIEKFPLDEWARLLSFYTIVRNALKEIDRLNILPLFSNKQNVFLLVKFRSG
jgi:hypothetical protein